MIWYCKNNYNLVCALACFQERPCSTEPSSHPPVPGVSIPFLFPPQPRLWDYFSCPVRVWVPLATRGWGGSSERGRHPAGVQTWTQHRKSEFKCQTLTAAYCNFIWHLLPRLTNLRSPMSVQGYIWCADVCWSRAKGDIPNFRERGL